MRFESTLLSSWSRREWLSIAVITVATAFLIGSAVLLLTAGSYTSTLEGDLGSSATVTYNESYTDAVANTDSDEIVFPLIRVVDSNDDTHVVIGIPPDAPSRIESASVEWDSATVPTPPREGLYGPVTQPTQQQFRDTTIQVSPHDSESSLFPEVWYIGSAASVESIGEPGALVIHTGEETGPARWHTEGAPLIAALPFLLGGLEQVVRVLSVGAVGGGVLILVVVYNVTRMSIRDRHREIRLARATGASPYRLFAVLQGRVLGLTGTGILLGFAVGVIATNAIINAATYLGLPVTIQTVITADVLRTVAQIGGFLLGMGLLAGVLASMPVVRGDPTTIGRSEWTQRAITRDIRRYTSVLQPTLVDWRALVPTTTTLAVFMLVILLTTAIGGAIAPLATTSSGTVVESGSAHPLNSRIDESYSSVLRQQNVTASPEVLYAQTKDGEPYLIRGANFTAFSTVSEVTLVEGHAPAAPDQAVVGADLAETLGLAVGETTTIGGSVTPGVRRVTIVGKFAGTGIIDDQLILPLETAQGLSTRGGTVHLIRTNGTARDFERFSDQSGGLVVTGLSGPSEIRAGSTSNITVQLQNLGDERAKKNVRVSIGNETRTRSVTVDGGSRTEMTVTVTFSEPGSHTVTSGGVTKSIDVYDPRALHLPAEYPERAPPDATLIVPAITRNETPIEGATVTLGDYQGRTNAEGVVPMRVPAEPGTYTLTVEKPNYTTERHTLTVEKGAPQRLSGRIRVSPQTGTQLTEPTVTIQLANPWGSFVVRNVSLVTPAGVERRTVEMTAGNVTELTIPASDAGLDGSLTPGSYDLRVVSDGTILATTTYRVSGDERITSTLASQGEYSQGTGIGRAIENVFGNVQVLFVVMIALAGASTIGGTVATFAHAVHANRRQIGIYRATGASRRHLLGTLVVDAIKLSLPSTVLAFGTAFVIMHALAWADVLVVFGIKLQIPLSMGLLVGSAVGAFGLAVGSALGIGYVFLNVDPGRLLQADR